MSLLDAKPLDQITVRDIAGKAGVGYATFFRHHPTKEALLDEIAAEQINALFKLSISALATQDLKAGSTALFSYVNEHRALWSTLLTGGAAATIRDEFLRQARKIAALHGKSDGWLPADFGTVLIVSGTLELLTWWLRQSKPLSIERVSDIHVRVIASPVIVASIEALQAKLRAGATRSSRKKK